MSKLLIATTNPGKVLEYKEILKDLPIELVTLNDLGISADVEEDGKTFEENAVKKVEFYSKLAGLPTLAEDSGLEIDYLNGEPGVRTKRWLGYDASESELISATLEKLKGVPMEKRGAQLRVVIALSVKDEKIQTFEGVIRGLIMEKPIDKIIPGYPFRTLFYIPEINKILGELTMAEEAKVAHRKRAIEKALPVIRKYLCV